MYKIIHIHSDSKFLSSIDKYNHQLFDNKMIIIGVKDHTNTNYHDTAIFYTPTVENIDKISAYASSFDLVTFEDLTLYNKKILSKIKKGVKVSWRFFGHELYNKRLDLMLSDTSVKFSEGEFKVFSKKGSVKSYYNFLKNKYSVIYNLYKYSKKIDHILLVFEEEYKFLKKHWYFLPQFIQVPLRMAPSYKETYKEDFFILGNSRNISNNHLDILKIINESKNKTPYKVKMFLSYGAKKNYYKKVTEEASKNDNVEMINDFMDSEKFTLTYERAAALVINSHRQMALGNILMAINNNCKIYLNQKNSTKKWLEKEGLKVFSIDEFKKDYEINNHNLSETDAKHNIMMIQKIYNSYNKQNFQEKILEIVKK